MMQSLSHWGMFHCWEQGLPPNSHWGLFDGPDRREGPGLPPMAEQPERSATYGRDTQQRCACSGGFNQGAEHYDPRCPHYVEQPSNLSWVHVPIGNPYPITNFTLAEVLTPHEDDLKLTINGELYGR